MRALIVCVMLVVGCKQGDKPPVTSGSGTGSGSGSGSAVAVGSGSSAGCVVTVAINLGSITYDGGGIAGNVDRKPNEPPHLDMLSSLASKCSAYVTADPALSYQDVLLVIDTLRLDGFTLISLGKAGDPPPTDHTHSATPPSDITTTVLHDAPMLSVSKTQVMFRDKVIANLDDPLLDTKLAAAMPPGPKEPSLIVAADAQTPVRTLEHLLAVAKQQGYTSPQFAMTKR